MLEEPFWEENEKFHLHLAPILAHAAPSRRPVAESPARPKLRAAETGRQVGADLQLGGLETRPQNGCLWAVQLARRANRQREQASPN